MSIHASPNALPHLPVRLEGFDTLAGQAADATRAEENVFATSGIDLSALVRDRATPANDFNGDLNSLLTYTAPSTKYILNDVGALSSGTSLRTHHDGLGNALGLWVEGAATNLFLYSEDFTQADWGKLNVTIAAAAAAPDGTLTATRITDDATNNVHQLNQGVTVAAGVNTISILAEAETISRFQIVTTGVVAGTLTTDFDLATETVAGSGGAIEALQEGRYRCTQTLTATSSGVINVRIRLIDAGQSSYVGTGKSMLIWGAQCEAGSFASSYIKTTGSQVTRSADKISLPLSDFPQGSASTYIVRGKSAAALPSSTETYLQLDDGTTNEHIRIYRDSSGNVRLAVTVGAVEQANINLGALTNSTDYAIAVSIGANDVRGSLNGGAVVSDTSATLPTCTTFRIGAGTSGVNAANSTIANVVPIPRALTDTQLIARAAA